MRFKAGFSLGVSRAGTGGAARPAYVVPSRRWYWGLCPPCVPRMGFGAKSQEGPPHKGRICVPQNSPPDTLVG